jgi:hypothetical protein
MMPPGTLATVAATTTGEGTAVILCCCCCWCKSKYSWNKQIGVLRFCALWWLADKYSIALILDKREISVLKQTQHKFHCVCVSLFCLCAVPVGFCAAEGCGKGKEGL